MLRLIYADWLEEQGRPEAAGRVRETVRIRPEMGSCHLHWWLWKPDYKTNGEHAPQWLYDATQGRKGLTVEEYRRLSGKPHPSESLGMTAILDAILEGS